MQIVCITGGIGSGKTFVAKIFEALQYPVYYSDIRAKQMYFIPEIKQQIIQILGTEAYINEKEINKKYIASKIFNDKNLLDSVNAIIHQAVQEDFKEFVQQNQYCKIIFKESALIFEAGLQNSCNKIVLVTAPPELKIKRIKEREHLNEEEMFKRMAHQWNDDKKMPLSDYIIVNDEKQELLPQIVNVLADLNKEN